MVNLFIALSFGVHREQLEQRIGLTWPRPFLLRPLPDIISASYPSSLAKPNNGAKYFDARFLTIFAICKLLVGCMTGAFELL